MGKTYASADWHGASLKLIRKVLDFLGPEDKLYFLGDAIDRGSWGLAILDTIIIDPRIEMIRGNHEQMMLDSLHERGNIWVLNGGSKTLDALNQKPIQEQDKYFEFIRSLDVSCTYKSPLGHIVILEHAGYTPGLMPMRRHDPLWDRAHFIDRWPEEDYRDKLDMSKTYIVHGHTPVQYLKFEYGYDGKPEKGFTKEEMEIKRQWFENGIIDWKPTIIRYCSGHKFDIDMCTVASNRIALLDLDTFDEIYFDKEEGE